MFGSKERSDLKAKRDNLSKNMVNIIESSRVLNVRLYISSFGYNNQTEK
jgi:hypothetical protein